MANPAEAAPTLSVVCVTNDPGPRVAAILAPLRAIAHEIVIAADDRVGEADLGWYGSVATRLLRYPFAAPVERPFAWAHAQCTGDWILRIDGDEVVGPELVAALPELLRREDRLQYWMPRRWLHGHADRWIDERPWCPDHQLRLVRNEPALLSFAGTMHTTARALEPYEILEAPIYHLDLLLKPEAARRAKAETYEALHPGMRVSGGGPQAVYYLPEEWLRRPTVPVPEPDAAVIAAVLAAPAAPAPAPAPLPVPPAGVPAASRAEVDAHWDALPLAPGDRLAELTGLDADLRVEPGAADEVVVRVGNRGRRTWPGGLDRLPRVRLGSRWLGPQGEVVADHGARAALPGPLAPGASMVVRVPIQAPAEPGRHVLELDLVDELVAWFEQPLRLTLEVGPRARPRRG